jgi:hypothetical protein
MSGVTLVADARSQAEQHRPVGFRGLRAQRSKDRAPYRGNIDARQWRLLCGLQFLIIESDSTGATLDKLLQLQQGGPRIRVQPSQRESGKAAGAYRPVRAQSYGT